jgi:hypothetical protein
VGSCRRSGRTHAVTVEIICSLPSGGTGDAEDATNPFTAVILYGLFGSSGCWSFHRLPQLSSVPSFSLIILRDSPNFIPYKPPLPPVRHSSPSSIILCNSFNPIRHEPPLPPALPPTVIGRDSSNFIRHEPLLPPALPPTVDTPEYISDHPYDSHVVFGMAAWRNGRSWVRLSCDRRGALW